MINRLKMDWKERKSDNVLSENEIISEEIFNTLSGIINYPVSELSESQFGELFGKVKNSMTDTIMLIKDLNKKVEDLTTDKIFLKNLWEGSLEYARYVIDESKKVNKRTGKIMDTFADASSAYEEMKKNIHLNTDIIGKRTIKKHLEGDVIIDDIEKKIKSSEKSNEHMIEQKEFVKRWKGKRGSIINWSREQENYLLEQRKNLKEQIKLFIDSLEKIFKLSEEVEKYRKWRIFRPKGSFDSTKFYRNGGFYGAYLEEIKKIYESYLNS